MASVYPRRSSYGIFVRFRRSRLALRRGVTLLEDALAIAEQLRASRFHDRGEIFVVKEPEGTIVETEPAAGAAPPPDPIVTAEPPRAEPPPAPALDVAPAWTPIVPPRAPSDDGGHASRRIHRERATVLRLIEQIDQVRRAIDRSHAALARLDRAFAAGEGLLQARGESSPEAFRRNHERLGALRMSAANGVASFEETAVLLERRLECAWADATAQPRAPAF